MQRISLWKNEFITPAQSLELDHESDYDEVAAAADARSDYNEAVEAGRGGVAGEPIDLVVRPPASPPDTGRIRTGPRVGVSGPGGDGAAYPWRFWLDGESSVSPYRPGVIRQRRRS